jgi:hypothetical protein
MLCGAVLFKTAGCTPSTSPVHVVRYSEEVQTNWMVEHCTAPALTSERDQVWQMALLMKFLSLKSDRLGNLRQKVTSVACDLVFLKKTSPCCTAILKT